MNLASIPSQLSSCWKCYHYIDYVVLYCTVLYFFDALYSPQTVGGPRLNNTHPNGKPHRQRRAGIVSKNAISFMPVALHPRHQPKENPRRPTVCNIRPPQRKIVIRRRNAVLMSCLLSSHPSEKEGKEYCQPRDPCRLAACGA